MTNSKKAIEQVVKVDKKLNYCRITIIILLALLLSSTIVLHKNINEISLLNEQIKMKYQNLSNLKYNLSKFKMINYENKLKDEISILTQICQICQKDDI